MSCNESVKNCCLRKGFIGLLFMKVKLSRNISPSMLFFLDSKTVVLRKQHLKTHSKWLPAFSVENDWKMCTVTVLPSCLKAKDKHLMLFACLATLLGLTSLSLESR